MFTVSRISMVHLNKINSLFIKTIVIQALLLQCSNGLERLHSAVSLQSRNPLQIPEQKMFYCKSNKKIFPQKIPVKTVYSYQLMNSRDQTKDFFSVHFITQTYILFLTMMTVPQYQTTQNNCVCSLG